MKFNMNKKNICLAAAALITVVSLSIGSAMAYFSTYVVHSGAQEIDLVFSETKIQEEISAGVKKITVQNVGEMECFVRVKVVAGSEHADRWSVANSDGWTSGGDGYYYFDQALAPEGVTSQLLININATDLKEEFNVIVIQENTPALYDENGVAYADWDRSEMKVTDEFGTPVSVKGLREE